MKKLKINYEASKGFNFDNQGRLLSCIQMMSKVRSLLSHYVITVIIQSFLLQFIPSCISLTFSGSYENTSVQELTFFQKLIA